MTRCKTFEEHQARVAELVGQIMDVIHEPETDYCYAMGVQALSEVLGTWLAFEQDETLRNEMLDLAIQGTKASMGAMLLDIVAEMEKEIAKAEGKLQ